jgi:sec-independent protein translocase protein TatB
VFDISFSELMVISVVALLVIGPEKLPKVARTVGAFAGRMQRFVAQVKEEVSRETRFEELQKLQQEVKDGMSQAESGLRAEIDAVQSASNRMFDDVNASDAEASNESAPVKKVTTRARKPRAAKAQPDMAQSSPAKKPRATILKKTTIAESVAVDKTEVSD